MSKFDWFVMAIGLLMLIGFKPLMILMFLFLGMMHLF